jgi:hypothetical protein
MTQETTPAEQEVEAGYSVDDAASELLKKWGANPESEEESTEEVQEPEQTEEVDAQTEETTEEEPEESDEVEIDVAGEKFKLPTVLAEQAKRIEAKVKEIEAGTTRKFQEAAEIRKVAEAKLQQVDQLQKFATENAELLADHRSVTKRLAALDALDPSQLDGEQLARLNHEYMQLSGAKQRIEAAYQANYQKSTEARQSAQAAELTRLNGWATKNVEGWSDEYSQTLMDFAVKELGADPDALRSMVSEPVIKALHLAFQGHKVKSARPQNKQVLNTKTLKPGAGGQMKTNAAKQVESATARLKRSGSVDDAASLLLARLNIRKR